MRELNDIQKEIALHPEKGAFVSAGAGTGKTLTLVYRLVHAIESEYIKDMDEAFVVTFTKKAATEIKERVREELIERGHDELAEMVDSAWISTIHGACERILKLSALDLQDMNIDPDFKMIEGHTKDYVLSQATTEILKENRNNGAFDKLFQTLGAEISTSTDSGLVEDEVTPFSASNSAPSVAEEIYRKASASATGFEGVAFRGRHFNKISAAKNIIEAYENLLSIWEPSKDSISAQDHRDDLIESVDTLLEYIKSCTDANEDETAFPDIHVPNGSIIKKKDARDARIAAQNAAREALLQIAYDDLRELEEPILSLSKMIGDRYIQKKNELGVMDNDDLLTLALQALKTHDVVRERFCGRFKLVMIDEFQDTDPIQYEIIKLLCAKDASICMMGDAQQSIYGFRGADIAQYRAVKEEQDNLIELNINYRSHDDILRFVNKTLGESKLLPDFMDLTQNADYEDEWPEGLKRIYVEHAHATGKCKGELLHKRCAEQVAERLEILNKAGISADKMVILMRSTNKSDILIKELRKHNLKSIVTAGSTFSTQPEVAVVEALLKVLANPYDTEGGLLPVLTGDMFSLTNDDLVLLSRGGAHVGMAEALINDAESLKDILGSRCSRRLEYAIEILNRGRKRMQSTSVSECVLSICAESGWLTRLENGGPAKRGSAANILACVRYIKMLIDDEGYGFASAPKIFADWLQTAKESPATLNEADGETTDAVKIMTVHAAKGLEFDVVVVWGCTEDFDTGRQKRRKLVSVASKGDVYGSDCNSATNNSSATSSPVAANSSNFNVSLNMSFSDKEKGFSSTDVDQIWPKLEDSEAVGLSRTRLIEKLDTGLDWNIYLSCLEQEASEDEDLRILYVALTRAQKALVFAIETKEGKEAIRPKAAVKVLSAIAGRVPRGEGVEFFEFGGSDTGELRTTTISDADGAAISEDDDYEQKDKTFSIYEEPRTAPPISHWKANQELRSYSGDIQKAAEENEDVGMEFETWLQKISTEDTNPSFLYGTAFHELAQYAAIKREYPNEERIQIIAKRNKLDEPQIERLKSAFKRWWNSDLRKEAFEYPELNTEVPFSIVANDDEGGYLVGYIDLLCQGSSKGDPVLIVDYKTGEKHKDEASARENHEMQAKYYIDVMKSCGYTDVSAAFVLVENTDEAGKPMVIRY